MYTKYFTVLMVSCLIPIFGHLRADQIILSPTAVVAISDSAGAHSTDQRMLIQFDLPDVLHGKTIDLAEIKYNVSSVAELSDGYSVALIPISRAWSPLSVSWSADWKENGTNLDLSGCRTSIVKPSITRAGTLNVTTLVQNWVTGSKENHGFIVFPADKKSKDFNLDNVAGNAKLQLVIYYTKD